MLDGFLRLLTVFFYVVVVPSLLGLIFIPPGLLCYYMGWSFYVYETVVGVWTVILASWVMAFLYIKGYIR